MFGFTGVQVALARRVLLLWGVVFGLCFCAGYLAIRCTEAPAECLER